MEAKHISELLPVKNSALQTQELKPCVIGEDEKKFTIALASKIVKDSSFDEVKEVLRYVMMKVGIRSQNLPNDIEKLVLYEHILENYGGHRIEEIKIAFNMAISGKLEFNEGESVIPYENFSCLYFSTIMNAYERWASSVHRVVVEPTLPKPEQRIFSQDELDNAAREAAEMKYQLFLRGGNMKGAEINEAILTQDGLLKPEERVIEFYKRRAEAGATNIYKLVKSLKDGN